MAVFSAHCYKFIPVGEIIRTGKYSIIPCEAVTGLKWLKDGRSIEVLWIEARLHPAVTASMHREYCDDSAAADDDGERW